MHTHHFSLPPRFIPFMGFHIAPLLDVTPAAVKEAARLAKTVYQDRERIKLTTAQNFIAKKLGFQGGVAGLHQEYESKLLPFMTENRLERRQDLITGKDPVFDLVSLKPREVSDALFLSGRPLPEKIFTGYGVDWYELDNDFFNRNPWMDHPEYEFDWLPYEVVMAAVARANAESLNQGRLVLDAAVVACADSIRSGAANLLGEQLLGSESGIDAAPKFVPCIYKDKKCSHSDFNAHEGKMREVAKFFRVWISQLEKGWVEVIPYNNCLVFLKGPDGLYDFVFPGFRDEPFNHNPFHPHLRNGDVPKSNDIYHFRRWLYFHFDGWLEKEAHHAEMMFYAGGRTAKEYKGPEEVLKESLTSKRAYVPPTKQARQVENYYPVLVEGAPLFVGNLVTIRDFREFMSRNSVYAAYSRSQPGVDHWESVNCEDDESLPAAVTWYDANAYAAWVSRTKGLPVRLLTSGEYQKIAQPIICPLPEITRGEFLDRERERLCAFSHPDGTPIVGHPPYMCEKAFQGLKFCFLREAIKWKQAASGLAFLVSYHFGEWLNEEGGAINCGSLSSLCYLEFPPERGRFSATSTGKCKSKKVGFRLCYHGELTNETAVTK